MTVARLQKAVQTWLGYRDSLLEERSELLEIIKGAGIILPRYVSDRKELYSIPAKNEVEQIHRLELNLRGLNTFGDFRKLIEKHKQNLLRVVAKEDAIKRIQINNEISGLVLGQLQIGSNCLRCWQPEEYLWLTECDLCQLREERLEIFKFWASAIGVSQLQIFELTAESVWSAVDLHRVRKAVTLADYAVVNEEISYFDSRKAVEIAKSFTYPNGFPLEAILADLTISMPTEIVEITQLSASPAKGLKERRLLYIHAGVGIEREPYSITNVFCGINISDILYNW